MNSYVKILLIIGSCHVTKVASEFKIETFVCQSPVKSVLAAECNFTDTQFSLKFTIPKPLNYAKVNNIFRLTNFLTFQRFQIKFEYSKKTNEKFQNILKSDFIDWCELAVGKSKINFLAKILFEAVKKAAPTIFHPCPYQGLVLGTNISFSRQLLALYPLGTFKLKLSLFGRSEKYFDIVSEYKIF